VYVWVLAAVNIVYRYVGTLIPRWLHMRSEKQSKMAGKYGCVIMFFPSYFSRHT